VVPGIEPLPAASREFVAIPTQLVGIPFAVGGTAFPA
jgi:hypothetical protein